MISPNLNQGIILGPMEGISDAAYRLTMLNLFPQWDYVASEFLRAPSVGFYKNDWIINFFGRKIYENPVLKQKSIFQILTSSVSKYQDLVAQIRDLGFLWLDLNLGCPSRTVNNHGGGAILLESPKELEIIIKNIRQLFPPPLTFSVKIRLGMFDDSSFFKNIHLFQELGVDYVTVHGRTRKELYTGVASWNQSEKAAQLFPHLKLIGNGDIWTPEFYKEKEATQLFSFLMLSRGALKYPWFPLILQGKLNSTDSKKTLFKEYLYSYFETYTNNLLEENFSPMACCKRIKAISRYIFEEEFITPSIKKELFRIEDLDAALAFLKEVVNIANERP